VLRIETYKAHPQHFSGGGILEMSYLMAGTPGHVLT
jgi:hypothetical protein